jgi:hypothetical protein
MVKFLRYCIYFILFFLAFLFFLPKENLYFALEKELKTEAVVIYDESIHERLFGVEIEHAFLNAQSIDIAEIQEIDILLLGLYNSVELQGILLSEISANFFPKKIEKVTLRYSIMHPLSLSIQASGEFGVIDGRYSLENKMLTVKLQPSKLLLKSYRRTLRFFKKSKDGEYIYEKTL